MRRLFEFAKNSFVPAGLDTQNDFKRDLHHQMMLGVAGAFRQSTSSIIILQILHGPSTLVAWVQAGAMFGFLLSPIYVKCFQRMEPAKGYARPHIFAWVLLGLAGVFDEAYPFAVVTFLASFLFSVSMPFQAVVYEAIYVRSLRGKLVALVKQWSQGVIMLVSWLLGAWLDMDGYSYKYFLPVAAVLGLLIAWRAEKIDVGSFVNHQRQEFSFRRALDVLRLDHNFLWFMIFQSLMGTANIAGYAVFLVYVNSSEFLGASPEEAALLTGVIPFAAMFLSVRVWGSIFDRMSVVHCRALTSLLMGLGYLLYPISHSMEYAILGAIVWGIGRGGGQLVWSIGMLAFAKSNDSATYMGIHTSLTGVRGVIAPFVGVAAIQSALSPLAFFWLTALLIVASAGLTVLIVENPERSVDPKSGTTSSDESL
ncbi:MAG: hypothetical protein KTR25_13085 [Myxococcales bacterium]|nr:hypothetical protein [Myxococcales bacterium]